jgi:acyl-CoA reductase-like NAD-dependent aldehyde dehydrogenase
MDQTKYQTTISPHSQQPYVTRTYPSQPEVDAMIQKSAKAQKAWGLVPVQVRVAIGRKFMVSSEHNVPSNILHGSKKYMLL